MKLPEDNWVKLNRNVDRAVWRSNPNIVSVWLWVQTHINAGDRWFYGGGKIPAARGQVVTTRKTLAAACGISEEAVRHALRVLIACDEIATERIGNSLRISCLRGATAVALPKNGAPDLCPDPCTDQTPDLEEGEDATAATVEEVAEEDAAPDLCTDLCTDQTPDPLFLYMSRDNQEYIKNTSTPPISPSFEEVEKYFKDKQYKRDPQRFFAYNGMKGWKVADWKAAADLWETYDREDRPDRFTNGSLDIAEAQRRADEDTPEFHKRE